MEGEKPRQRKTSKQRSRSRSKSKSKEKKQNIVQHKQIIGPQVVQLSELEKDIGLSIVPQQIEISSTCTQPFKLPIRQVYQQKILSQLVCRQLEPATFCHWVHYQSKCQQILDFLEQGYTKESIITWIQDNNRMNFGIEKNCQLLAEVQSEQFWNFTIHEMLIDVMNFSHLLPKQTIKFLNLKETGVKKIQIGRGMCYLILSQWFFGLIPPQFHLRNKNYCSFSSYMEKEISDNENENFFNDFNQTNLKKLHLIIYYFNTMSADQNHEQIRDELIIFKCKDNIMKQGGFINQDKVKKQNRNQYKMDQFEENFGEIGNKTLVSITLRTQNDSKEKKKNVNNNCVFFETENQVFNEEKFKNGQQSQTFFLEHTQSLILKLLFHGFQNQNTIIEVQKLRKWATFREKSQFLESSKKSLKNLKAIKDSTRVIISKRQKTQELFTKDYAYDKLRAKILKYLHIIKIIKKGSSKDKQIIVNFDEMSHEDIFLNFLMLWIAISQFKESKYQFLLELGGFDRSTKYSLSKINKYFSGREIADVFSVVRGYELLFIEKKKFFSSPLDIPFLQYIKRHVF